MKKYLLMLLGALMTLTTFAQDFEYTYEGQTLKYTIIEDNNVCVGMVDDTISGDLEIPSIVIGPEGSDGNRYWVVEISYEAFKGCTGLTSVTIPDEVSRIGYGAFSGCSGLTSVKIGDSVYEIGAEAFSGCSALTSVTIPDSVTEIGGAAFINCSLLTSVTIPNSVKSIEDLAFYGCYGLKSVTIPDSVTSIGKYAFYGCTSLISVTIPVSVTKIDNYAFRGCSMTSVTISGFVSSIGIQAFSGCSCLTEINVAPDNEWLSSIDGVLFDKDKTTLLCYPGGKSGDYIIPASVTAIAQGAFLGCIGLTSVTIPRSITEIGEYAFYISSGLKSIYYDTENPICLINTLFGGFSADCYKNTTLFVPATAIETFKQTFPWSQFSNIQAYDFASIDEIASDVGVSSVYDLAGRPVLNDASASDIKSLAPGVYIVRKGDDSKKIVVR